MRAQNTPLLNQKSSCTKSGIDRVLEKNFFLYNLTTKCLVEFTLIGSILIIDDNMIFCNALKSHFTQKEYNVKTCISFREFKDKIDIKNFDLIFLDLRLQDAEGLDILESILEICPDKKVIIISSYLDDECIAKAKEIGAFQCIPKNSQLFEKLDYLMNEIQQ